MATDNTPMITIPGQSKPAQSFAKRLRRAFRNVARVLMAVVVIIVFASLRGCFLRPATSYPGDHFNKGQNAVWLGVEWVRDKHSAAEIANLAADLQREQIAYVFVYTTYMHGGGQFGASYDHAADFLRGFKQAQPTIKVLAWIGLPLNGTLPGASVDLSDESTRQSISNLSAQLINNLKFDGVHLDPEIIADGDKDVLSLLQETRQAIGSTAILSIAAHSTWPFMPETSWTRLVGPLWWGGDYYRQVASRVDQIVVMTYDSGLKTPFLYRQWMRFQAIGISRALENTKAELLFGIPTSEEATATHDPGVENMVNGLDGLVAGFNDLEARPAVVTGIAIYPYWETDAAEWLVYNSQWLGTH